MKEWTAPSHPTSEGLSVVCDDSWSSSRAGREDPLWFLVAFPALLVVCIKSNYKDTDMSVQMSFAGKDVGHLRLTITGESCNGDPYFVDCIVIHSFLFISWATMQLNMRSNDLCKPWLDIFQGQLEGPSHSPSLATVGHFRMKSESAPSPDPCSHGWL